MIDTETAGQGHKQHKKRHESLKRVKAHDYIKSGRADSNWQKVKDT